MRLPVALVAVLLSGCTAFAGPTASAAARPSLGVSNGTTLPVTLFVNGQRVADDPAGAPQPDIDVAALPPLPWSVEARSPSGRVLTSMTVRPGDVSTTTGADGVVQRSGTMGRVDLSCGSLRIWAGFPPSGPAPAEPAGSPGDCAP